MCKVFFFFAHGLFVSAKDGDFSVSATDMTPTSLTGIIPLPPGTQD